MVLVCFDSISHFVPSVNKIHHSTHYSYKNWYYRGDDFLFITRFEQMISLRDSMKFTELVTWYVHTYFVVFLLANIECRNDFGESH
jgi:hypothetical protein